MNRHRGRGLKGPVGKWVQNELQNYSHILTRIRYLYYFLFFFANFVFFDNNI